MINEITEEYKIEGASVSEAMQRVALCSMAKYAGDSSREGRLLGRTYELGGARLELNWDVNASPAAIKGSAEQVEEARKFLTNILELKLVPIG